MSKFISHTLILALIWTYLFSPVCSVMAQENCQENLRLATQNYYEGKFDTTITLIKACLEQKNLTTGELIQAYKILAQAYLAKNYPDAARRVLLRLLELDPTYSPTIEEEPPQFVELVNSVRQETMAEPVMEEREDTKWLWIGAGGVLLIGVATILALSSGSDEDTPQSLPSPPAMPPVPNE